METESPQSNPIDGRSWQEVKGELITHFKTLTAVAIRLGCHSNTLRDAVEGHAPNVRARLAALLLEARKETATLG